MDLILNSVTFPTAPLFSLHASCLPLLEAEGSHAPGIPILLHLL